MTQGRGGSGTTDVDHDGPTRQTIIEAMIDLLAEDGYAAVTTDAIAARAHVSKSTIYRLWRTKHELVVDVARQRFQPIDVPGLGDFEEEVRHVLAVRIGAYRQPGLRRLMAGLVGAAASDDALMELLDQWHEQVSATLRGVVRRGIARGDVRPDIDIYALETLISAPITRSVVARQDYSEQVVDELAGLIAAAAAPV